MRTHTPYGPFHRVIISSAYLHSHTEVMLQKRVKTMNNLCLAAAMAATAATNIFTIKRMKNKSIRCTPSVSHPPKKKNNNNIEQ